MDVPRAQPPTPKPASTSGVEIAPGIRVPEVVLRFSFARSSGPGGQNVNKLSTKAILRVALADLPLRPEPLERLKTLATFRLVGEAPHQELLLSCEQHRSQEANKQHTLDELRRLIVEALKRPKTRRKTKPSRGAQMRRLESKKHRSEIKRLRRE